MGASVSESECGESECECEWRVSVGMSETEGGWVGESESVCG